MNDKETNAEDNFSYGDIPSLLRKMAIPGVVSQILLLLYNMVDRIYLGRLNDGGTALLAVGLCLPVTYIFNAFAFMFGQGGAARAMIRLGSGRRDEAEDIMGNSVISIVLSGAVLTVIFYAYAKPIMYFLGASDVSIDAAVTYMRIYTIGAVAIMGYMGFLQFVISQGATRQAMLFVVSGALMNVILDPILIFGFDMGVAGAAAATVLSQLLIAVLCLWFLTGKRSSLTLRFRNMKLRKDVITAVVTLGFSPFLMQITESALNIAVDASAQKYGGDVSALGITLAVSLSMVIWMPSSGINQGAQALLSYNYGSKNYDRVMLTAKTLLKYQFMFFWPMTALLELFPQVFIHIFTSDQAVIREASWMVRVYVAGFFIIPIQMVFQQIYLSTGQEKACLFMVMIRKLVLHFPLLFILPALMKGKVLAVVLSAPVSDVITVIVTVLLFMPGFYIKMNKYGKEISVCQKKIQPN
ncbi:MAG: MATE family efflux transporter [Lachnospiraceae bacterium]|nr:MATE family efflux transporter [Lachnospiraceae bacterium]